MREEAIFDSPWWWEEDAVTREEQYLEFSSTCRDKDLPVPTPREWEDFVKARGTMSPHSGYAKRMVKFAEGLSVELPLPIKIHLFAPPTETGLGLMVTTLDWFTREPGLPEVSVSSVFDPEPTGILARNRNELQRTPPVTFSDEGRFCLAGTEKNWSPKEVEWVSKVLAQKMIVMVSMNR